MIESISVVPIIPPMNLPQLDIGGERRNALERVVRIGRRTQITPETSPYFDERERFMITFNNDKSGFMLLKPTKELIDLNSSDNSELFIDIGSIIGTDDQLGDIQAIDTVVHVTRRNNDPHQEATNPQPAPHLSVVG